MNTAGGRQAAETGTDGLTLVQLHFFVFHLGLIYLRAAQMASTIHHLGSEAPLCDTVPKQECTTCGKTGTTVDAAAGDGGSLSESSTSLLQCSGCHCESGSIVGRRSWGVQR